MHPYLLQQLAAERIRDLITEASEAGPVREARHPQRRRLAALLRRKPARGTPAESHPTLITF